METFLFYVYDTILSISFDGALTDQVTNNALKTSSKLANCYSIGGMLDALRAICGPEMKKVILIVYAQKPLINAPANAS